LLKTGKACIAQKSLEIFERCRLRQRNLRLRRFIPLLFANLKPTTGRMSLAETDRSPTATAAFAQKTKDHTIAFAELQ
jgi:hypothetical protein